MNAEKKLAKNTLIYGIGNIGSKILAYIMVLVYSHYISSEDLGYYDLILTTLSMFAPIISAQIQDAVYRYIIENKVNNKKIISSAISFLFLTTFFSEIAFLIFSAIFKLKYKLWISLYIFSLTFYSLFQEILRGLKKNKIYAAIGIINSILMLVIEMICLIGFNLGVISLLAGNVISMLICIIIVVFTQNELNEVFKFNFDTNILKQLLKYSLPLVPNTICWWIVNSSDRYIILLFLGTSANGIYAISNKFPTILTTITSIFHLAWQETALSEYNTDKRDILFSSIFKKYFKLLFSMCLCAIPLTQIVIELFVGPSYKTAWLYSGFLFLGASFSALSNFLGLGYQISKETNRSILTTIIAAVINLIVNVLFINYIGLFAASFSTFFAYLFLFIIRLKHTKRYFNLKIEWQCFSLLLAMNLTCILLLIYTRSFLLAILFSIIGIMIFIYYNFELIYPIIKKIWGKII